MHKLLSCKCGSAWQDSAYSALRVTIGLAFFYHGYVKVFVMGMDAVTNFFASVGIPAASVAAPLVAYGELLGGLAVMLGFMTHWVAKVFVLIIVGAIGFVHWGATGGWFYGYGADGGYEYQLLLLVGSFYLMTMGSGKYALDSYWHNKETSPANQT